MFSILFEVFGFTVISFGLGWAISVPAGLIFGGAAMVFIGSATDDEAVGMALRRGTAWIRYAWWSQLARENGIPIPRLGSHGSLIACTCGGRDEGCPLCDGTGLVPDPTIRVNSKSPHPPLRIDPQAEEFSSRLARVRIERAKARELERIG